MKLKDIKIETQLIVGFCTMILFVFVLGIVSNIQSNKLHQQTKALYDHPLQVRRAISCIKIDISTMRIGTRDLMIATNENERQAALQEIELSAADIPAQFNILNDRYLGQHADIDEAYKAYMSWKTAREVNTKLAMAGDIEAVKKNVTTEGSVGIYREKMMAKIQIIDNFALKKGETIYANSIRLKNTLQFDLILLVVCILILSTIIIYLISKNINVPVKELINTVKKFQQGDLSARSSINSKNEFGVLSDSFNRMVESIETNIELNKKASELSIIMLQEEEPREFFNSLLPTLASLTNSQMAAVYLLSEDKKQFEHFVSFGMSDLAKHSFSIESLEGEFGSVLSTRKLTTIKRIPKDTRFVFNTVSGKLVPREIITVPIISGKEIIAIISIASVRTYSSQVTLLIKSTLNTLTSRIEGVLSYQRIQDFSKKLEFQNRELEAQKIEMQAQSIELTEQNRELEMHKIQLDEANKLKTSFLSNMSHELRTPLNSVIALSGVLSRRLQNKIPSDEFSYLEVIERNGKHLLTLINDILDISRIESGREEIEISRFTANDLISDVVNMIKPQAQQKQIELIQKNSDEITIRSDFDKCRHILQNLVANAVKFTENGAIEIGAILNENNLEISVKDSGIGISENHIDHIFDEFRQADAGTSRKFGGTGLGLSIAKKYANLLGGNISVKSKLAEGSVFTVVLPLNYSDENRIVESPIKLDSNLQSGTIQASVQSSIQKTILIVEDSEPAIIQIKDFLEESGYKILVANGGSKALEIISHTIPDGIILDLMMPEVDGFEVLKTIREAELTAHVPVLILTAKHITKDDLKFLKRNNVHQLIQKGDINRLELLGTVANMLSPKKEENISSPITRPTKTEKPQILIVEDNLDNMITVKALLGDNFRILEAEDGAQGIMMAKKHRPDLILMDIALPGVDGIEAFKAIRNDDNLLRIPIIALTASAMASDKETILAHGFDAYLAKPINEKVFFNTIDEMLYGK